jgi:hypothetical protein
MCAPSRSFQGTRTLTVLTASLLLSGGCLIPGINDATSGGGTEEAAQTEIFIAPERLAPLADENVPSGFIGLAWTAVPGATEYDLFFGVDPNPPLVATVTAPGHDLIDLPVCTTHYWRVVARNETQALSSPTWKFKTVCP